jgi:hypothetical protein
MNKSLQKPSNMKRNLNIFIALLFLMAFFTIVTPAFAQEPPHPPSVGHGTKGNQAPAGAPIDGGLSILLALGAAYGARKYNNKKSKM